MITKVKVTAIQEEILEFELKIEIENELDINDIPALVEKLIYKKGYNILKNKYRGKISFKFSSLEYEFDTTQTSFGSGHWCTKLI